MNEKQKDARPLSAKTQISFANHPKLEKPYVLVFGGAAALKFLFAFLFRANRWMYTSLYIFLLACSREGLQDDIKFQSFRKSTAFGA